MILGTPGSAPYGGCYGDFNLVEANMKLRYHMKTTLFTVNMFVYFIDDNNCTMCYKVLEHSLSVLVIIPGGYAE